MANIKCDHKGCTADATTKGHVYGHIAGSTSKDGMFPVNACNVHRRTRGFFEDGPIKCVPVVLKGGVQDGTR